MKIEYPNLRQAYISSTTYSGWSCDGGASNPGYREPVAFEEGISVKYQIQKQINGLTDYQFGTGNPLPWISWGPYLWDNSFEQSWYTSDGTHPNTDLKNWVAQQWFDFLDNDPTSNNYFHKP